VPPPLLLSVCRFAGVNVTQGVVKKAGIQNQLSAKYYGLVGLASLEALKTGGAPPPALAGE
jgi:hypothetical protein